MTLQPHELLLLVLLAAWAAADTTAFGQFMIGQPIPAGLAAGWLLGEPVAGFVLGALLQLLWSRLAPVGAASYPDVGPATVGGAALLVAWLRARGADWPEAAAEAFLPARGEAPTALLLGLLLALVTGWLGQKFVAAMRRGNATLGARANRAAARGDFGGVERANLVGLVRAAGAGALLVTPALALAASATLLFGSASPLGAGVGGGATSAAAAPANPGPALFLWSAIAAAATSFWPEGRRDLFWLAGGLVLGGGLVAWLA
jgi:mannose/fructose/N-acetylgalactosamine-specific phosphotransferase system component IIC